MAKAHGLSHAVVHHIWRAHGLQPHCIETFKLSCDPDCVAKLRDVVGVYLNPPAKALVFCIDEKPQVQALDRTVPARRDVHLILDNYATHTHPTVDAWFTAHPRYHRHFVPTSGSCSI